MKFLLAILFAWATLAHAAEVTNNPSVSEPNEKAGERSTNNPAASTATAAPTHPVNSRDYSAFKVIPERNIFNPNRSSRGAGTPKTEPDKAPRIDSFALRGTMIYEKGSFAFFDGSNSDYRKVLTTSNSIAGFTLKDIDSDGVKLEKEGKAIQLAVGQQLKRQNEGDWSVGEATNSTQSGASSGSSTSSSRSSTSGSETSSSSGSQSDVLKRLLEKREKELKK